MHVRTNVFTPSAYGLSEAFSEGYLEQESEQVIPTLKPPIIPSCLHNKFQTPYCGIPHAPPATSALIPIHLAAPAPAVS